MKLTSKEGEETRPEHTYQAAASRAEVRKLAAARIEEHDAGRLLLYGLAAGLGPSRWRHAAAGASLTTVLASASGVGRAS